LVPVVVVGLANGGGCSYKRGRRGKRRLNEIWVSFLD